MGRKMLISMFLIHFLASKGCSLMISCQIPCSACNRGRHGNVSFIPIGNKCCFLSQMYCFSTLIITRELTIRVLVPEKLINYADPIEQIGHIYQKITIPGRIFKNSNWLAQPRSSKDTWKRVVFGESLHWRGGPRAESVGSPRNIVRVAGMCWCT